jgi:hypothetical protein
LLAPALPSLSLSPPSPSAVPPRALPSVHEFEGIMTIPGDNRADIATCASINLRAST